MRIFLRALCDGFWRGLHGRYGRTPHCGLGNR
ncbi:hypothetical protein CI1B_72480 [Bradyrhizobium ivorense]|uniref:Uncharacterized protein n=1 Tax=Bradyrhizobium ivorense TaxID=2511166 RepID=A0A508TV77_9BRAD|nr:hypothetical protein CI1B_72480 [Bradyrhizobium ivorense]